MWISWNSTPKRHANQWNNADNDNKELKDRLYICDGQMATIFNVKCKLDHYNPQPTVFY